MVIASNIIVPEDIKVILFFSDYSIINIHVTLHNYRIYFIGQLD